MALPFAFVFVLIVNGATVLFVYIVILPASVIGWRSKA